MTESLNLLTLEEMCRLAGKVQAWELRKGTKGVKIEYTGDIQKFSVLVFRIIGISSEWGIEVMGNNPDYKNVAEKLGISTRIGFHTGKEPKLRELYEKAENISLIESERYQKSLIESLKYENIRAVENARRLISD